MICKYCNKEVPDGSKYCPFCGGYLEEVSNASINQIKEGSGPVTGPASTSNSAGEEVLTPENYRSVPTYKPRLHKMIIFSGIAFVLLVMSLFGSLMVKIIGGGSAMVPGIIMLIMGLMGGIVFLALALSLNKKIFPQVNMRIKGIEIIPVLFISFGLVCGVVALVLQGIVLVVY